MPDDTTLKASEAAEGWLNTVGLVSDLGKRGSVDAAYRLLSPLQNSVLKHAEILDGLTDEFSSQSDSPVKWEHGRGLSAIAAVPSGIYPHIWSSATEAAAGIARLALGLLLVPLDGIEDPVQQREAAAKLLGARWKALEMTLDEIAMLQERVRRERVKVLRQKAQSVNAKSAASKPKGKAGRKSSVESDRKIAEEYWKGLNGRDWTGQADYLRKKHRNRWNKGQNAAKAWLSTLLKRVELKVPGNS